MLAVDPLDRRDLSPLFDDTHAPRTFVDCALQGHGGAVSVDDPAAPAVARIELGPFVVLGGNAGASAAPDAIDALPALATVVGAPAPWRSLILRERPHADAASRKSFALTNRELGPLLAMAGRLPDGYRIERLDLDLTSRLGSEVSRSLLFSAVYRDADDFASRGVGYCVLHVGRMVAGATAALLYDDGFEIQVNTNEPHRGMGLATAVSAALIAHALREGSEPHWDTSNVVSERLARKLGYTPTATYETLMLGARRVPSATG